jgi:hypothetical protein
VLAYPGLQTHRRRYHVIKVDNFYLLTSHVQFHEIGLQRLAHAYCPLQCVFFGLRQHVRISCCQVFAFRACFSLRGVSHSTEVEPSDSVSSDVSPRHLSTKDLDWENTAVTNGPTAWQEPRIFGEAEAMLCALWSTSSPHALLFSLCRDYAARVT